MNPDMETTKTLNNPTQSITKSIAIIVAIFSVLKLNGQFHLSGNYWVPNLKVKTLLAQDSIGMRVENNFSELLVLDVQFINDSLLIGDVSNLGENEEFVRIFFYQKDSMLIILRRPYEINCDSLNFGELWIYSQDFLIAKIHRSKRGNTYISQFEYNKGEYSFTKSGYCDVRIHFKHLTHKNINLMLNSCSLNEIVIEPTVQYIFWKHLIVNNHRDLFETYEIDEP